jgi:hypothetical protein
VVLSTSRAPATSPSLAQCSATRRVPTMSSRASTSVQATRTRPGMLELRQLAPARLLHPPRRAMLAISESTPMVSASLVSSQPFSVFCKLLSSGFSWRFVPRSSTALHRFNSYDDILLISAGSIEFFEVVISLLLRLLPCIPTDPPSEGCALFCWHLFLRSERLIGEVRWVVYTHNRWVRGLLAVGSGSI